MAPPARFRSGDTITWVEQPTIDLVGNPATSATWTGITYLRFNSASEAVTVSASAQADGTWSYTISSTTTTGMDAGTWYWQTRLTSGSNVITQGSGSLIVDPSLVYAGTASAFDGRSQAEKDLEAVQSAIRALISKGAKQYTIGSRSYTSMDLAALMEREAQLKAVVARERAAEKLAAGLGNPGRMFVRFV